MSENQLTSSKKFINIELPGFVFLVAIVFGILNSILVANSLGLYFIGVLGAILVAPIIFLRPYLGLIFLLISLYNPFFGFTRLAIDQRSYILTAGFIGILGVRASINTFSNKERYYRTPLDAPIILFVFWALGNIIYSLFIANQTLRIFSDFFQATEFCVLFFITKTVIKNKKQLYRVLISFLIVALTTLLTEIGLYWTQGRLGSFGNISFLVSYSVEGEQLLRGLDILAALILPVFIGVWIYISRRKTWRPFIFLVILLSGFLTLISFTRSFWLSVSIGLLYLFIKTETRNRLRLLRLIIFSVLMILIAGVVLQYSNLLGGFSLIRLVEQRLAYTVNQLFSPATIGQRNRQIEILLAGKNILRSPLFGIGLGGYYIGPIDYLGNLGLKHWIHNTFIQIPLRMGIPALVIFLWIIQRFFHYNKYIFHKTLDPIMRGLILGIEASVIGLLFQSLFIGSMLIHPISAFLGVAMALPFVINNFNQSRRLTKNI